MRFRSHLAASEAERVAALRDLLILDTAPESRFDVVTEYAKARFKGDIAYISLIDSDRQWFKSKCGFDAVELPRAGGICAQTILQDDVLVINDATCDPDFADNAYVVGEPYVRFYAGAPLKLASGHNVGTLCIIGLRPGRLDEEERDHLKLLAHLVAMELQKLGPIEDCQHCPYGADPQTCSYRRSPHDLPPRSGSGPAAPATGEDSR